MSSLERAGMRPTFYRPELLLKKLLSLLILFLLSFSAEKSRSDVRLAQTYFHRGYIEYSQENFSDAIAEFNKSFMADREGYYGELSYLYIGISYAQLSYRLGRRDGILSAVAYLNMYPYYYKRPTYVFLQREFIGYAYLLAGFYDKAKDVFLELFRDTQREDYLLNFLYADSLSDGFNAQLLGLIDPTRLVEKRYLYHMVRGFYAFKSGDYSQTIRELVEARNLNRYVEEDPEFLYRIAVSSFMEKDWRNAVFNFELLDRKDTYRKYTDSSDYYLAMIYLNNKNYADAKKRVDKVLNNEDVKSALLISQLWLFPEFLQKSGTGMENYQKLLRKIGWRYKNSIYSTPAILGLYYYALSEKKIHDVELLRLKELSPMQELVFQDIHVDMRPLWQSLKREMEKLNPYSKDSEFVVELYKNNPKNYALIFDYEKISRAITYLGRTELKDVLQNVQEPLKSFLMGQLLILEGSDEGPKMIESVQGSLSGDDRNEAAFLVGLYGKKPTLYEGLVNDKLSDRLKPYLEPALVELGDYYYTTNFFKAKDYYRRYLEMAQENDLYWLVAYKLAKLGEITRDQETINWVVKKAEGKDNILCRVIVALWG